MLSHAPAPRRTKSTSSRRPSAQYPKTLNPYPQRPTRQQQLYGKNTNETIDDDCFSYRESDLENDQSSNETVHSCGLITNSDLEYIKSNTKDLTYDSYDDNDDSNNQSSYYQATQAPNQSSSSLNLQTKTANTNPRIASNKQQTFTMLNFLLIIHSMA